MSEPDQAPVTPASPVPVRLIVAGPDGAGLIAATEPAGPLEPPGPLDAGAWAIVGLAADGWLAGAAEQALSKATSAAAVKHRAARRIGAIPDWFAGFISPLCARTAPTARSGRRADSLLPACKPTVSP